MKALCTAILLPLLACVLSNGPHVADAWNGVAGPFWYQPFGDTYADQYKMNFSWSIRVDHTNNDQYLVGTFTHNVPNNNYVGIGTKSPDKMDGLMICCVVDSSKGISRTTCMDWLGEGYDVEDWPGGSQTNTLNGTYGNLAAGEYHTVTFERKVISRGTDLGIAAMGAWDRTIWAWGPMEMDDGELEMEEHPGHAIAGASIDFASGVVQIHPTGFPYFYLCVFWGVTLVLGIMIRVVLCTGCGIHHWVRIAMTIIIMLIYTAIFILHILASYKSYYEASSLMPLMRAIGDGATFCLMGLLLTVSRRFFFSEVFDVSHERSIKFHMILGIILVGLLVWHAIGMSDCYGSAFLFTWRTESPPALPVLPGFLAECCFGICTVFGLFRLDISYKLFRLTHYFWVPSVVFTCLHYPRAIVYLGPALFFIVASWVYGRIVNCSATVTKADYHKEAETLVVEVERTFYNGISPSGCHPDTKGVIGVGPAQWFYLAFPKVSYWQYHPFSVARADVKTDPQTGKTTQVLKFAIKSTHGQGGAGSMFRPCLDKFVEAVGAKNCVNRARESQSWTTQLCDYYGAMTASPIVEAGRVIEMTVKTAAAAVTGGEPVAVPASSTIDPHAVPVSIEGGFGSLQLPLHKYRNIVLVSGGIGVTPNLLIFQHLAVMSSAGQKRWDNIVFIWVCRDDTLLPLFENDIAEFAAMASAAGVNVSLRLFITSTKSAAWASKFEVVRGQRPVLREELRPIESATDKTAMYVCGPVPLIDSTFAAANQSSSEGNKVHVHSELFNV